MSNNSYHVSPSYAPDLITISYSLQDYKNDLLQLGLGFTIAVVNIFVLCSMIRKSRLKNAANLLFVNICLVNLLAGISLCLMSTSIVMRETMMQHRVDTESETRPRYVAEAQALRVANFKQHTMLLRSDTSLIILNCYVNIASLLALITNKYITIKSPRNKMTLENTGRILLAMWVIILTSVATKGMIYIADVGLGWPAFCFTCYQVFELVTLNIFTLCTLLAYGLASARLATFRTRTVHDRARVAGGPGYVDYGHEYIMIYAIGGILLVFAICFATFIATYLSWITRSDNDGSLKGSFRENPGQNTFLDYPFSDDSDLLTCIFFLHCLVTPIIICVAQKSTCDSLQRMACCCCRRRVREVQPEGNGEENTERLLPLDLNEGAMPSEDPQASEISNETGTFLITLTPNHTVVQRHRNGDLNYRHSPAHTERKSETKTSEDESLTSSHPLLMRDYQMPQYVHPPTTYRQQLCARHAKQREAQQNGDNV